MFHTIVQGDDDDVLDIDWLFRQVVVVGLVRVNWVEDCPRYLVASPEFDHRHPELMTPSSGRKVTDPWSQVLAG